MPGFAMQCNLLFPIVWIYLSCLLIICNCAVSVGVVVSSRFLFEWPLYSQCQSETQFEVDEKNTIPSSCGEFDNTHANCDKDGDINVKRRKKQVDQKVITIEHSLATSLQTVGFQVWPGAIFLCDYVLHMHHEFTHKVVLELGAGTGLCSIVAAMFASRVLCTDFDQEILKVCQRNADNNSHLTGGGIGPHQGATIHVKQLDWLQDNPFHCDNCDRLPADRSKWKWNKEDFDDVKNIDIILASDVIYDTKLTDHFFHLIIKLLAAQSKRTLYISLERRLNFTLEELDICCPAYDHFIVWTKRIANEPTSFKVQQITPNFPTRFQFGRTKYMELWRITCQ